MNEVDKEYLEDLRKDLLGYYRVISANTLLIRATLTALEGSFSEFKNSEATHALRTSADRIRTNVGIARRLVVNMTTENITDV